LSLVKGALIVRPITPQPLTLDELLRGVTDENLHGEWETGPAVGKEVW
jgi:antitoxin MazE